MRISGCSVAVCSSDLSSASSVVVMIIAPLLGGLADRKGYKKRFLFAATLLGAISNAALFSVAQGNWPVALGLFTLGSIGFFAGTTFYDSLIVAVAGPDEMDRTSALGYGLGYLGGGDRKSTRLNSSY